MFPNLGNLLQHLEDDSTLDLLYTKSYFSRCISLMLASKHAFIPSVPLVSVYHCNVLQSHQGSMTSIAICYQLSWLLIYQCWPANDFGYTICICYPNMFEVYSEQPFAAKLEISLINNRNKKGPRTHPCGTPDEISTNGDSFPLQSTAGLYFSYQPAL